MSPASREGTWCRGKCLCLGQAGRTDPKLGRCRSSQIACKLVHHDQFHPGSRRLFRLKVRAPACLPPSKASLPFPFPFRRTPVLSCPAISLCIASADRRRARSASSHELHLVELEPERTAKGKKIPGNPSPPGLTRSRLPAPVLVLSLSRPLSLSPPKSTTRFPGFIALFYIPPPSPPTLHSDPLFVCVSQPSRRTRPPSSFVPRPGHTNPQLLPNTPTLSLRFDFVVPDRRHSLCARHSLRSIAASHVVQVASSARRPSPSPTDLSFHFASSILDLFLAADFLDHDRFTELHPLQNRTPSLPPRLLSIAAPRDELVGPSIQRNSDSLLSIFISASTDAAISDPTQSDTVIGEINSTLRRHPFASTVNSSPSLTFACDTHSQHERSAPPIQSRKSSELKGNKKAQALRDQEAERQRQAVSRTPPKIPDFYKPGDQLPLSNSIPSDLRTEAGSVFSEDHHHGNYSARPSMEPSQSVINAVPIPPIPNGGFDPYARTESMTHRGRYSYASSAISTINSPRRVRRRKDPTPFNILIIGTRGAGKTSFLEFLKTALALPPKKRSRRAELEEDAAPRVAASGGFIPHYLETEIDGERVGLTLWDSEGLEKNVVDLQLREMSAFLESRFEETFAEEMKVIRSPGVQDTHVHAAFILLDPSRLDRNLASAKAKSSNGINGRYNASRIFGGLDEDLDLQVMRTLQGKTTVIPVISKADTITTKHMAVLKKAVWDSIKKANLDPLEALGLDDDGSDGSSDRIDEGDEDAEEEEEATSEDQDLPIQGVDERPPSPPTSPASKRLSGQSIRRHKAKEEQKEERDELPFLPLSLISPDLYEPEVAGRQFPWGFADPYNEEHCDFTKLKDAVFSEWRAELREASREQWYEGWRTSRLKNQSPGTRRR